MTGRLDTRKAVRFWDELNGCPEEARAIGGEGPTLALMDYAEDDHDGLADGLYVNSFKNTPNPHPFIVEFDDGTRERWTVEGELEVTFHAHRKCYVDDGEGASDGE